MENVSFDSKLLPLFPPSEAGLWCSLCWFFLIADIYTYCWYFQPQYPRYIDSVGENQWCLHCWFADCIYICFYSWYFQPQYPKYIDSDEDNQQCLWCLLCWFSWLLMCIYIAVIFSYNIPNILVVIRGISVCDACSADCIYLYIFLIFSATIL